MFMKYKLYEYKYIHVNIFKIYSVCVCIENRTVFFFFFLQMINNCCYHIFRNTMVKALRPKVGRYDSLKVQLSGLKWEVGYYTVF